MKKEDLFDIVTDIDEKKILDANPATYKGNVVEMPKKVINKANKSKQKYIKKFVAGRYGGYACSLLRDIQG